MARGTLWRDHPRGAHLNGTKRTQEAREATLVAKDDLLSGIPIMIRERGMQVMDDVANPRSEDGRQQVGESK